MSNVAFLSEYEFANDTIVRFHEEYPNGRIYTFFLKGDEYTNLAKGYCTVKTEVYRDQLDVNPAVTNIGYGNVDFYPANMKKWFVEDTWTSCISRAIKTLSPSKSIPSAEDMARVEMYNSMPTAQVGVTVKESRDPWTMETVLEETVSEIMAGQTRPPAPECRHGHMLWKEGEGSRGKYAGWVCAEKVKANQCKAQWLNLNADGRWV
jgi:hypothetical protein